MSTCSVPQCDRPAQARGWCNAHYAHWFNNGTTPTHAIRAQTPSHARGFDCPTCGAQAGEPCMTIGTTRTTHMYHAARKGPTT